MRGSRRHNGGDDTGMGCLVAMVLCLVAMPLVGLYLILKQDGDSETKAIGWILLVVGIIIWLVVMARGGH